MQFPTKDQANRLAKAFQAHEKELVVWTLSDSRFRVAELAHLTKANF